MRMQFVLKVIRIKANDSLKKLVYMSQMVTYFLILVYIAEQLLSKMQ